MAVIYDYLKKNGLSELKLSDVSFGALQEMLKSGEVTDDIYNHLVTLSGIRDSELAIAQTTISRDVFNSLVFLDGFPTTELVSEGRTTLQVAQYVDKTYPTKNDLKTLFSKDHWFDRVQAVYEDFDYTKFDPLILAAPAINNEAEYGPLYLKDGCHRSLALGIKTNNEGFEYKSASAIIVYYNRDKYDNLL